MKRTRELPRNNIIILQKSIYEVMNRDAGEFSFTNFISSTPVSPIMVKLFHTLILFHQYL